VLKYNEIRSKTLEPNNQSFLSAKYVENLHLHSRKPLFIVLQDIFSQLKFSKIKGDQIPSIF
jgi:hypothetical protein